MIDYATNVGWATPLHNGRLENLSKEEAALNKPLVLEALAAKCKLKKCTGFKDATNGAIIEAIIDPGTTLVVMVKGAHQAKFFSANVRDQGRIDQTHYQVLYQGAAHHIYVTPNMSQQWDITEIT